MVATACSYWRASSDDSSRGAVIVILGSLKSSPFLSSFVLQNETDIIDLMIIAMNIVTTSVPNSFVGVKFKSQVGFVKAL